MWQKVPFRDSRGRVVPWGYAFLGDDLTLDEVADLLQRAFGRRAFVGKERRGHPTAAWPRGEPGFPRGTAEGPSDGFPR
jgi:hypothetical protein